MEYTWVISAVAVVVLLYSTYGLICAISTLNGIETSNKQEFSEMAIHSVYCHVITCVLTLGYLLYTHVRIVF